MEVDDCEVLQLLSVAYALGDLMFSCSCGCMFLCSVCISLFAIFPCILLHFSLYFVYYLIIDQLNRLSAKVAFNDALPLKAALRDAMLT